MSAKHILPTQWSLAPALAGTGTTGVRRPRLAAPVARHWFAAAGDESGETVVVRRRRPAGPGGDGPRERAEAPERQREEGNAPEPPKSGGSGGGGGGGFGGGSGGMWGGGGVGGGGGLPGLPKGLMPSRGCGCSPLLLIGLLLVGVVVFFLLFRSGGAPQDTVQEPATFQGNATALLPTRAATATPQPAARPRSTATSPATGANAVQPAVVPGGQAPAAGQAAGQVPTVQPEPAGRPGQRWTVLLYQDADDKVLEQDIYFDLNEAERVGSSDRIKIVTQIDRYRSGFNGDGNWVGARRYLVSRDNDLNRVGSQMLADLGSGIDMSDPKTLVDFVTCAVQKYPADKYVLILSDHGMGWPGGFTSNAPKRKDASSAPLAAAVGNQMFLSELDTALNDIRARAKIDKFELIGLDACLMSQLEVYTALAPHARYAVASEETEPALGWAYTAFLTALTNNPDMSGADLARQIVSTYIQDDERIVDDQARAEYMRQGSPMGGLFESLGAPPAAELAAQLGDSVTLTAFDLGRLPALQQSVNDFALALQGVSQPALDKARTYAQSFTSIFGEQVPPSYIDLGHFAALAGQASNNADVGRAATAVQAAIKAAVLAEKHGPKKAGATGVAIYFPNSQLYRLPAAGPQSYTVIAQRFAGASLWNDFLAFHYTGRRFTATNRGPAVPDRAATITAPGAGQITVGPVQLSANTVAIGNAITMKAAVTGDNVGYVYFFTGYLDRKNNSINVADTDYLESPQSRKLNGVTYPDWPGGRFTLQFDWEPLMFSITDGTRSAQVLLTPESYGAAPELAVYTVDGLYAAADGSDTRYARLYFSNGILRQVMGFTGPAMDGTGPAHEITPATGDKFTVLQKWLDLDASGKVQKTATQRGATLTFGRQTFTWKQLDAAAGDYVVGFIVEDLDGNQTRSFTTVHVQ